MNYILSGEIDSGKSTRAAAIVQKLIRDGKSVSGFITPAHMEDGKKIGHDLILIDKNKFSEPIPFTRLHSFENSFKWRRFYFSSDAFSAVEKLTLIRQLIKNKGLQTSVPSPLAGEGQGEGNKTNSEVQKHRPPSPQPSPVKGEGEILMQIFAGLGLTPNCDLFIMDEIGPLELEDKKGFYETMLTAVQKAPNTLTVVREEMKERFCNEMKSCHCEGALVTEAIP